MQDYNTIINNFLQYKHFLGYKYKTDEIVLNEIKNYLLENKVDIITKEVTEDYARINSNLRPNTIARNMGVFRELCKYIKQQDIECYQIPNNIYPQNHKIYIPYIFSHEEIKNIYNNLETPISNYHYRYYIQKAYSLIIKLLYQTGMRIGEVLNLTRDCYNYELGIFTLKETKNGQERNIAIPDDLNERINEFCNKFVYDKEDKIFKTSIGSVNNYFKKVLKVANIKITDNGPTLHCLRHTYVVHNIEKAIEDKVDLNVFLPILQSQLGHQSLNSLSYYFHITNDVLKVVNKISEEELAYLISEVKYEE